MAVATWNRYIPSTYFDLPIYICIFSGQFVPSTYVWIASRSIYIYARLLQLPQYMNPVRYLRGEGFISSMSLVIYFCI
jgi:hypothetical protein